MHPVLEELKNEIGDAARIAKIDVDQHEELAARDLLCEPGSGIFKRGIGSGSRSGGLCDRKFRDRGRRCQPDTDPGKLGDRCLLYESCNAK